MSILLGITLRFLRVVVVYEESTTTRNAGGVDLRASGVFPRPYGRGKTKARQCFNVAVVIRPPEAGKPQADLKTTNKRNRSNWVTS